MKSVEIKKDIYWVGGIDWNLRNFHGYLTQRGTTYNAYLILDEKITLIDTVKHDLVDEMFDRISHIIDPAKIDYIVSTHVEMDHSGGLPRIMEVAKDAVIYTSQTNGKLGLKAHYNKDWELKLVKTGDVVNIGRHNLNVVLTPMVHWPDNMAIYVPEENILFSSDSYGQHLATSERFDDEYHIDAIVREAKKYYVNIVLPYSRQVQKALAAMADLDIEIIAPAHGMIWRSNVPVILEEYKKWAANQTEEVALIIYDTMWNSTEMMAYAIEQGFEDRGIRTKMLNIQYNHISDIMTEVMTARYICVGSPTLNSSMLPAVGGFLTYFKGLAPKNRVGLAFGSYGWNGQSVRMIEDVLKSCGFEMLTSISHRFIPDDETLHSIAEQVKREISDRYSTVQKQPILREA